MMVVGNQGYVSSECIHWKIYEQIGIGMAYLHAYTIREIETVGCGGVLRTPSNRYDWPFLWT